MEYQSHISLIQNKVYLFIEKESSKPKFILKLAVLSSLLSVFFATPAYHYIEEAFKQINWEAVFRKANNPLDNLSDLPEGSHAAKKVFRITVPLIIRIFSLDQTSVYIIQFFMGISIFAMIYSLFFKLIKDTVSATLLTVGIGFIYFGKACFIDLFSWFDGWAFFFLLSGMLINNFFLIFIFSLAAGWTDERAVMILPVLLLFHQVDNFNNFNTKNYLNYIKLNKKALAVLLALCTYVFGRILMSIVFNMHTPDGNANFLRIFTQTDFWGFGVWSFLEGFWLIIFVTIMSLLKNKDYIMLFFITTIVLIFSIIANIVNDITRSGSYLVPILFIVIPYLFRNNNLNKMRNIIFWAALVSFIFPAYAIITDIKPYFLWYKPIFIRFIDYLVINNYI